MPRLAAFLTVLIIASTLALTAQSRNDGQTPPAETAPAEAAALPARHWVKLTVGLDEKAVPWDGQVTISGGRILETAPWSFEDRDRFDSASHRWFCTTVVVPGRSKSSYSEPDRGVLIHLERGESPVLHFETQQGNFDAPLSDLTAGRPALFLDGRASVELLGSSQKLTSGESDPTAPRQDDFPSLAIDAKGQRWVAWISWEEAALKDHLCVANLDDPSLGVEEIATAREQVNPQLQTDAEGRLWLFWAAPQNDNWDLWAARRGPHGWGDVQQLTHAAGSDFHLTSARGPRGEIWLAWQTFRNGNSDILVKRWHDGRWSEEIPAAATDANEWEPSISIAPDGTAWIGYDSYLNGNYDVYLTRVRIDEAGEVHAGPAQPIAATADFEAHASVEATADGIVWVACDAAGPNWGKDFTRDRTEFQGRYGETLHASRRLILKAVVDGRLVEPEVPLSQELTQLHPQQINHSDSREMKRFYELPHLTRDAAGRLWVFYRMNRQGYAGHPPMGVHWEFYGTTFVDGAWIEPILMPRSDGRQNQRISVANDPQGRMHAAWSTGDHLVDLAHTVRSGQVPPVAGSTSDPPTTESIMVMPQPVSEPLVRSWPMQVKDKTYHVYFGDLHRHTDISLCTPTIDGCLVDAYRYALDGARLDFLGITDHTRDTDPYPWWRSQKTADLFRVKGVLAPIYSYERSNSVAGGGHRNVFFIERDWPIFRGDAHYRPSNPEPKPENNDPDVALYPHLRGKNAFTAAHTPGYAAAAKKGTWTFHDPQVEPLAEIIQTYRRDYERPGAPQWREARDRSDLAEEASLWYALARGYRLGFIASSDHHATHTSFACVWAEGPSREEIFEALRSRRTYAATDKILLDVRMGNAVLGEEIAAPAVPELAIRVRGTAPINEIQIVRNREVIHTIEPNQIDVQTRFRDEKYPGGEAYYYVRIRQVDDNMAWGSPIWVK